MKTLPALVPLRRLRLKAFAMLALWAGASGVLSRLQAVTVQAGDILVSDAGTTAANTSLLLIPASGTPPITPVVLSRQSVGSGPIDFVKLSAAASPTRIYYYDPNVSSGAILQVDPATGDRTVISSGVTAPQLTNANTLELVWDPVGQQILVNYGGTARGIVKVDVSTGARSYLTGNGVGAGTAAPTSNLRGLAVAAGGAIYMYDQNGLVSVDRVTGNRTLVSAASNFVSVSTPGGLGYDDFRNLVLVSDANASAATAALKWVSAAGVITVATGGTGSAAPGSGTSLDTPRFPVVDSSGNVFYRESGGIGNKNIVKVANPGPANVRSIYSAAGNYTSIASSNLTLVRITPPSITSALVASGTYGSPIAAYTITATASPTSFNATGLPPGLSVNPSTGQITGTPTATTGSPFNVTLSATNADGTGTATLVLTIDKAPLTITAEAASRAYFAADPAFTATITGFVNGDTPAVVTGSASFTTDATPTSAAGGSYTITPATGTLSATNYAFATFVPGALTITKIPLAVTADAASRTYGAADPSFSASYSGFVNGETAAVISGVPGFTTDATISSGVGSHTITPDVGTLSATNYSFTAFNAGVLLITPAPLSVIANAASRAYGAVDPSFSATYAGFVNGDTIAVVSGAPAFATNATLASAAGGGYAITPSAGTLSAANYAFSFVPGALTITQVPLVVTADNASRTYGAANPAFTASLSGFVNGDTSAVVSGSPGFVTTATAASPVGGSYPITPSPGTLSATNYSFGAFVDGTLSVTKAVLTVTADDASRSYGAANPALTATITGFVNSETLATAGVTGTAAVNTVAGPSSPVGTYPTTATAGTLAADNYSFTFTDGTLTVTTATLLVTADDQARTYGATNPIFTYTLTGFANGETAGTSGVTGAPALTTTAVASSAPGSYPITAGPGTLAAGNYAFTFATGTLAVTKAPLTVTAGDASRVYGAANPAFTATLTGFVNGETLVTSDVSGAAGFTTTATAASGVGPYAITPTAGTLASANYSFASLVDGTLTVTPAALTVTANDASRLVGVANPAFTATISGFVNGDTVGSAVTGTPSLATTATLASPAGAYPITVTSGTLAAANYTFATLINGTLTVTAATTATITLSDLRQAYDGTPKSATATTTPAGLTVGFTYNGNPTPPTLPGSYAVEATIDDPNYTGATTGTLEIVVTALVRHGPVLNGGLDGSLQVLLPESFTLNGSSYVSGDLLVPGTPTVRLNGQPTLAGVVNGTGSVTPSNHTLTLNGSALVRYVLRRTDPIPLPTVTAPQAPAGTRSVALNSPTASAGDFATLRNLTLNGNAGVRTVPAGAYGNFIANGSSGFVFGTVGATVPAVYHLQQLTLNGGTTLQIVGPVILKLAQSISINGTVGGADHPDWLSIEVQAGGLTLNGSADLYGRVVAPNGTVIVNGNASLHGTLSADRLTINGNGLVSEDTP